MLPYRFPNQHLPPTYNPYQAPPAAANPVAVYAGNAPAYNTHIPAIQHPGFPQGPLPPLPPRAAPAKQSAPPVAVHAAVTTPPPPATQAKPRRVGRKRYVFTALDLVNTVLIAAEIGFYDGEHGSKHLKEGELGKRLRDTGLDVSDGVCKARLEAMLKWHSDPDNCMAEVREAMDSSDVAANTVGAPLDILSEALNQSIEKTDSERAILKKKAEEDKAGGNAIREASMRSRRRPTSPTPSLDSDEIEIVEATPSVNRDIRRDDDASRDASSDVEVVEPTPLPARIPAPGKHAATPSSTKIKKENRSPSPPALSRKTTLSSINVKLRKRGRPDTDTPTRSTKRIRRHDSFDIKAHLLEDRELNAEYHSALLSKIDDGNKQYAEGIAATTNFQNRFLDIIGNAFRRD
ncbi:hypothetical protein HWV62_16634 [Athelia sp. TMB]|nr:hypothetical protein HWV62_16634 [Athelia sp. TMB]